MRRKRSRFGAAFKKFALGECTDAMLADYAAINQRYWRALERGEVTKQRVLVGRFEDFFAKYGLPVEKAAALNEEYQVRLGDTICFTPHALETVKACREAGILQYAVTNGTKVAQARKLARSGLIEIFDGVFISDEIGFEKPTTEFFTPVLAEIGRVLPGISKSEILIVGDSLTSDMRGGVNAGIATCWYRKKEGELPEGVLPAEMRKGETLPDGDIPGVTLVDGMRLDFVVGDVGEVRGIVGI